MQRFVTLILLVLFTACASAEKTFSLRIIHTNDLHGMMLPFDYAGQKPHILPEPNAGGLARRATLIEQIRSSTSTHVVVVDTGDIFTRGPWYTKFFGKPEIETMNRIGYDFMTVGNNEFKATDGPDSQEKMLELVRASRFPWLAANLSVAATGAPVEGIRPYVVKSLGELKVCFLGLTAERVAKYPQAKGWTIENPISAAKKVIPEARTHCKILIALTHIDAAGDVDEKLAAEVEGIDAIVGGDSHTFLTTPKTVKGPNGSLVPIAQAGELGVRVGQLDLDFEKSADGRWFLKEFSGKLIPVNSSIPENADTKHYLSQILF